MLTHCSYIKKIQVGTYIIGTWPSPVSGSIVLWPIMRYMFTCPYKVQRATRSMYTILMDGGGDVNQLTLGTSAELPKVS